MKKIKILLLLTLLLFGCFKIDESIRSDLYPIVGDINIIIKDGGIFSSDYECYEFYFQDEEGIHYYNNSKSNFTLIIYDGIPSFQYSKQGFNRYLYINSMENIK